mmetsp:Transcript_5319/g.11797  ORF Transcript_5319/g.11797 Transcript_5319/m.11797 type:complete len:147 (-) Transcript_5319:27-467(-)
MGCSQGTAASSYESNRRSYNGQEDAGSSQSTAQVYPSAATSADVESVLDREIVPLGAIHKFGDGSNTVSYGQLLGRDVICLPSHIVQEDACWQESASMVCPPSEHASAAHAWKLHQYLLSMTPKDLEVLVLSSRRLECRVQLCHSL